MPSLEAQVGERHPVQLGKRRCMAGVAQVLTGATNDVVISRHTGSVSRRAAWRIGRGPIERVARRCRT